MKFADFTEQFLQVCVELKNSPGELEQKRMCLRNHLLPYFGQLDMDTIGMPEVRTFINLKTQQSYKPNTIDGYLIILNRFLTVAREERALTAPKFVVRKPRSFAQEARYLSEDEMAALLRAAAIEGGELYSMIRFVLQTGLRIGEVMALQRTDVDAKGTAIIVRGSYDRVSRAIKSTKNGVIRSVPLTASAKAAIESVPAHPGTAIFTLSYHMAHMGIRRVAKAAGLTGVGWHTLRHTFATMLVAKGAVLHTVARLLGHKSVAMTEIYSHLSPASAAATTDLLAAF